MSRWAPIPLIGGCYADDTRPWTVQDTCNWLPARAEGEGTRSSIMLKTPPGLQEFAYFGTRHRGARNVEGKLFCVSGTGLYQVFPNGAVSLLGTIPGTGRVSMTHNQIAGGNELLIVNGSAGYIWNTVTSTLTRITDPGYPGAVVADYIAHTFVQVEPQKRYAFNSALDDGLDYNALEQFQGESKPDRIVSHIVANGEYVLLNERSMDHFDYIGVTNELFRNKLIPIDRGCAATFSVCLLDNATFLIGDDGCGYEKRGYELRRITTHAIEQAWARCNLSKAYAFTWEDRGHKVWYVTFPEAEGRTWGYDVATRLWHRRESYGLNRWRLATMVFWNGAWYGGDYASGRLYRLNWDYPLEGLDPLVSERIAGPGHDHQNQMLVEALELVFDTGGPEVTPTSVLPLQLLRTSGNVLDAAVGDSVAYGYQVSGGRGPYTFDVASGALPAGTFLSSAGVASGIYTTAEHDNAWTARVTDADGTTATVADTCYVMDMFGTPPNGAVDSAYSYTLTGAEGDGPYSFALVSGALPAGLTLASDGEISGTPTTIELAAFSVRMTDASGVTQTKAYTINISEAVVEVTGSFGYCVDNWLTAWLNGTQIRSREQAVTGSPISIPADLLLPTGNKLVIKCEDFGVQAYAAFSLSVTGEATTEIFNGNSTGWIYKQVAQSDTSDYSAGITGGSTGGQTPFASQDNAVFPISYGWPTTRHGTWDLNTFLWLEYDFDLP